MRNPQEMKTVGRPRRIWENNSKFILKNRWDNVSWINVVWD